MTRRNALSAPQTPLHFALPGVPRSLRVADSAVPRLLAVGRVCLAAAAVDVACVRLDRAGDADAAARHLRRLVRLDARPDLVLVGPRFEAGGDCVWAFVRRLREGWPWQAWALVAGAGAVTPRGEQYALALGARGVVDGEREFARLLDLARTARGREVPPPAGPVIDPVIEPAAVGPRLAL